ncbi:MAG TPA: hypothetical protein VFM35_06795 [Candidatus Binatia bacterium]|nr:hypothetical protein [Candidatus Binatia bacterium]
MQSNQLIATKNCSNVTSIVAVVLGTWLAFVFILGTDGAFVRPPGALPLPILVAVTVPIIVFLITFRFSPSFHAFVLSLDLRLATVIQAWRFAGLGFLALYAYGVLPGLFAWPAGVGDIAIGVTAPWIVLALIRQPNFVASPVFTIWNLLGILDLVVAVGTGALSSALATGVAGEVTTAPMAQLPLLLIPAYLVPIFVMLHLAALFQARRLAVTRHSSMLMDPLYCAGKV